MTSMKKARARTAKAKQFFLEEFARKGRGVADARKAIQRKFRLSNTGWYTLKPKLSRMVRVVEAEPEEAMPLPSASGTGVPAIAESSCPPEVAATLNQLLAVNGQQEVRIQNQQLENASLKSAAYESSSRVYVLKKAIRDLLSVM